MIIDSIMLPVKRSVEWLADEDINRGLVEGINDYYEVWEKTPFEITSDDATIIGEIVVNPLDNGNIHKVVILCHGQTARRISMAKYGKLYYELGYSLVLFDERYFGESSGEYCTLGYKESLDIKNVIGLAKKIFGEDMFWGLHGESMGAASSLLTLDSEKPDFVVADCPFSDLSLLIKEQAYKQASFLGLLALKNAAKEGIKRYNYDYTLVKPIEAVKKSTVPICFMHGNGDTLINCKHSEAMFAESKNDDSEIHLFENAEHACSLASNPQMYLDCLTNFLNKVENK